MLIYDHNKEFIGIDDESLELLGYDRFSDLVHEHKDIAELFVKKPGYIHNFTNFPWIDFVLHAESDDAKVIIAGKKKAFSATISISIMHISDHPDEDGFVVSLKNIQSYQLDISERPEPTPTPFEPKAQDFNAPAHSEPEVTPEPQPTIEIDIPVQEEQQPLEMPDDIFMQDEPAAPIQPAPSTPKFEEEELDIFFHDEEPEEVEEHDPRMEFEAEVPEPAESIFDNLDEEKGTPMLGAYLSDEDKQYLSELEVTDDYVYDPQIAADELGLPVDLIEEFIGDFIKQAHEFKEQLFTAIENNDFDNIKVLSHKLKGVAANLRIEDSFEVLRNVNETSDVKECEANLKKFYLTVAKLEGKDIEEVKRELETPKAELYDLTPKFEPQIEEEEVLPPVVEEEPAPLDLPSLDEEELYAAPDLLESAFEEPEPEPAPALDTSDDDIYDYGLIKPNDDTPLVMMEDEDEILSEINDFDIDEEPLSDIQDFDTTNDVPLEELPTLTYDVTVAASEIGLSADLVSALIEDYIVEANEMKPKLDDVIASGDVMRWKGYAIQLKGVSDNLRINDITDALQKLVLASDEQQAKAAMQEFYGFINQL